MRAPLAATWTLVLALAAPPALADGRIYAADYTPEIAEQRVLIAFDGAHQLMMIENRLALPEDRKTAPMGWVVPVPADPELAVADPDGVRILYRSLRHATAPRSFPLAPLVILVAVAALVYSRRLRRRAHPDGTLLRDAGILGLLGGFLSLVSLGTLDVPPDASAPAGVEVMRALQIGPLDLKVLRATTGAALTAWLKENGFAFGARDAEVAERYARERWRFVAAKLTPAAAAVPTRSPFTPALVLRFPAREAVYPVALTAAGGQPLEVALYVFAKGRIAPSAPLHVAFAGPRDLYPGYFDEGSGARKLLDGVDTPGYLTKLTGRLDAASMREDIRFADAAALGAHREWTPGPFFVSWLGGAAVVGLLAWLVSLASRGRWPMLGHVWFMIAMSMSWILAVLLLFANLFRLHWRRNPEGLFSTGPRPPSAP